MGEPLTLTNHKGKEITLSPSQIGDFRKSKHLFWLEKNLGIKWPRGIFPSLPGGMDRVLKPYYDKYRAQGVLPPDIIASRKVEGTLYADQGNIDKWRSMGKSKLATYVDHEVNGKVYRVKFHGMIDDAVVVASGALSVFDYKTRGAKWKEGDTQRYYGPQADGYDFLFQANGLETTGVGYFSYYWPELVENFVAEEGAEQEQKTVTVFRSDIVKIETSGERCLALIKEIIECLVGDLPEPQEGEENNKNLAFIDDRNLAIQRLKETQKETAGAAS